MKLKLLNDYFIIRKSEKFTKYCREVETTEGNQFVIFAQGENKSPLFIEFTIDDPSNMIADDPDIRGFIHNDGDSSWQIGKDSMWHCRGREGLRLCSDLMEVCFDWAKELIITEDK